MTTARIAGALEAYAAALNAETHYRTAPATVLVPSPFTEGEFFTRHVGRCVCGWTSQPKGRVAVANRAAGLHVGAAGRRLDRLAKIALDAKLAELDEDRP